jgi:hypothetical protein
MAFAERQVEFEIIKLKYICQIHKDKYHNFALCVESI